MSERAVQFGEGGYLVGVWSAPEREPAGRPAFIFLNAGLVHRSGPSRAYVDVARRLSAEGFASLRFDHGGIGDSENRRDALSLEEGEAREVGVALDYLADRHQRSSFVLVGLCSGARLALRVAAQDSRVVGVVSVDGSSFRTRRFWWHRFRARERSVLSYLMLRLQQRMSPRAEPAATPAMTPAAADGPHFNLPSWEDVSKDLKRLVTRNVQQYWFFTGSFRHRYNYLEQHEQTFPDIRFGDLLCVEYMPDAEHILTSLSSQRMVVEKVARWAVERWPAGAARSVESA